MVRPRSGTISPRSVSIPSGSVSITPQAATIPPQAALISSQAATISPLAGTISGLPATISPRSGTISPQAASIIPRSVTIYITRRFPHKDVSTAEGKNYRRCPLSGKNLRPTADRDSVQRLGDLIIAKLTPENGVERNIIACVGRSPRGGTWKAQHIRRDQPHAPARAGQPRSRPPGGVVTPGFCESICLCAERSRDRLCVVESGVKSVARSDAAPRASVPKRSKLATCWVIASMSD
jgi:hypothetical protein